MCGLLDDYGIRYIQGVSQVLFDDVFCHFPKPFLSPN